MILAVLLACLLVVLLSSFVGVNVAIRAHDAQISDKVFNAQIMQSCHRKNKKQQRIIVYQCGAYKKFPASAKLSIEHNKAYCKRWNYEYRYIDHSLEEMPPYWLKTYDLQQLLADEHHYDYVMYLDLDAMFVNHDTSLSALIEYVGDYDVYIGEDAKLGSSVANTGAFLVKNSTYSRELVSQWLTMCFDKSGQNSCGWNFNAQKKKWACDDCEWAGDAYEQGTFNTLVADSDRVVVLDYRFMSNEFHHVDSFIIHLMGSGDDKCLRIFSQIVNKQKIQKTRNYRIVDLLKIRLENFVIAPKK